MHFAFSKFFPGFNGKHPSRLIALERIEKKFCCFKKIFEGLDCVSQHLKDKRFLVVVRQQINKMHRVMDHKCIDKIIIANTN